MCIIVDTILVVGGVGLIALGVSRLKANNVTIGLPFRRVSYDNMILAGKKIDWIREMEDPDFDIRAGLQYVTDMDKDKLRKFINRCKKSAHFSKDDAFEKLKDVQIKDIPFKYQSEIEDFRANRG